MVAFSLDALLLAARSLDALLLAARASVTFVLVLLLRVALVKPTFFGVAFFDSNATSPSYRATLRYHERKAT
jgi:hypothetical protein